MARDYGTLLDIVFLTHRLHAWGRTLGSRVGRMPKVHLVDSGLGASLLGINEARLASAEPSALTEYGHLVETFAVNEILKQSCWSDLDLTFGHFRTRDDHEVDLVAETTDGRIIGVEVKAGTSIPGRELAGLQRLRDLVGPRFVAGIALYAGNRSYTYEDRLHILPMDSLWGHWEL